jgi:class 3 adenylate cyclase
LWGNIGAADRLDFTAIGPAVNLVSRLEGLCRPLGRSVLISGSVFTLPDVLSRSTGSFASQ